MMTFRRRARTKQLHSLVNFARKCMGIGCRYYARGKDMSSDAITSAIHIVADRETPTRQCTSVAVPARFPTAENFGSVKPMKNHQPWMGIPSPMKSKHRSNSFIKGSTPLS